MERVIISAPFGNHFKPKGATPTLGTFTLYYRGGLFYRLWRMALTLRYHSQSQSWINKLGLPNPGIGSLPITHDHTKEIISIHGFNGDDWLMLANHLRHFPKEHGPITVELNLSCPNVGHDVIVAEVTRAVVILQHNDVRIIAKLPPIRWMDWVHPLYDMGIRMFHCCNTIPTPGGGMSGKPLKQYSLCAVEDIKDEFGSEVTVIGGGGITCLDDVRDYVKAEADHVALGSMLLNPFNHWGLEKFIQDATALFPREEMK